MKKIIIIGAGGHCRAVISVLKKINSLDLKHIIDIDFKNTNESIMGYPISGSLDFLSKLSKSEFSLFIAVGNNKTRSDLCKNQLIKGFNFINIIDPSSFIDPSAVMGTGNFIGPYAHIGPNTKIGSFNIFNTNSNLEHESVIGNYCQMSPGAIVCGRSKLLNNIFIGANATILENITIANDTTIGAGSVIIANIVPSGKTFIGVPGKEK